MDARILTTTEILKALDHDDGIALNAHIRAVTECRHAEFNLIRFENLDFTAWDRYHTWLRKELNLDK